MKDARTLYKVSENKLTENKIHNLLEHTAAHFKKSSIYYYFQTLTYAVVVSKVTIRAVVCFKYVVNIR